MSKRNGDRARFQKERYKKMLRREQTMAVRKSLASRKSLALNDQSTNAAPDTKPHAAIERSE
jgi:hypothetical protein